VQISPILTLAFAVPFGGGIRGVRGVSAERSGGAVSLRERLHSIRT